MQVSLSPVNEVSENKSGVSSIYKSYNVNVRVTLKTLSMLELLFHSDHVAAF